MKESNNVSWICYLLDRYWHSFIPLGPCLRVGAVHLNEIMYEMLSKSKSWVNLNRLINQFICEVRENFPMSCQTFYTSPKITLTESKRKLSFLSLRKPFCNFLWHLLLAFTWEKKPYFCWSSPPISPQPSPLPPHYHHIQSHNQSINQ